MKALTSNQVDQLLYQLERGTTLTGNILPLPIRTRNTALARLMLDAGLRVSEACAVRDEHIRWDDGKHGWLDVAQGKGRKQGEVESVPMSAALADAIRTAQAHRPRRHEGIIIWGRDGHLTRTAAWRVIATAADLHGMHIHPHMLRHTTATTMLERGIHIRVIQRMLRHRRIDTTMRYMAVRDPMLDDAIAQLGA